LASNTAVDLALAGVCGKAVEFMFAVHRIVAVGAALNKVVGLIAPYAVAVLIPVDVVNVSAVTDAYVIIAITTSPGRVPPLATSDG
jgi:hypothetical protein